MAMQNPALSDVFQRAIPKKILGEEFRKIIESPSPDDGFQLLLDCGIMQHWITEAAIGSKYEGKMSPFSMEQNNLFHTLTLDQHTLQTLKHSLVLYAHAPLEKQLIMRLTAIFHDFGKMYKSLQRPNSSGATSYYGHEIHSAALSELFLSYMELHHYIPHVKPLVRHHMRPHCLVKNPSPKAIVKLLKDLALEEVDWEDLLNQAEADTKAKAMKLGAKEEAHLIELNALREKITSIEKNKAAACEIKKTLLNGHEIMQLLNRNDSGPWIQEVLNWIFEEVLINPSITKEEMGIKVQNSFSSKILKK